MDRVHPTARGYPECRHYLGLKFMINGKTHYGWARLSVTVHKHGIYGISLLSGYAYETIPNKPIIAGKTNGKDVSTSSLPASAISRRELRQFRLCG